MEEHAENLIKERRKTFNMQMSGKIKTKAEAFESRMESAISISQARKYNI